ncbi:hypothetical protein TRIUR3_17079 [Triticum urartu]|uniref:Uncharacterized protein n=1 Tax=Triticum urartu TaxID=4572 RepID=M7YZV3_TRIUA|nr:hypothetical protein TRIUR3_17079 [Triticum urartu]
MVNTRRCRVALPEEGDAGNHPLVKDHVGWHFPATPSFPDFTVATAHSPPIEAERAQRGRAGRDGTRALEARVERPEEQTNIPLYLPRNTNMVVDCRICGDPHSVGSHSLSSLVKLLYLHMGARAALNLLTSSPCSSWQRKDHQLPYATLAQVKSEDGEPTDRRKVLQMVLRGAVDQVLVNVSWLNQRMVLKLLILKASIRYGTIIPYVAAFRKMFNLSL